MQKEEEEKEEEVKRRKGREGGREGPVSEGSVTRLAVLLWRSTMHTAPKSGHPAREACGMACRNGIIEKRKRKEEKEIAFLLLRRPVARDQVSYFRLFIPKTSFSLSVGPDLGAFWRCCAGTRRHVRSHRPLFPPSRLSCIGHEAGKNAARPYFGFLRTYI